MENKMKTYLKTDYRENNHIQNFCLYWMKASDGEGDEWRKENDLDCMYYKGDLRADTLISVWTPMRMVLDYFNKDKGMVFRKRATGEGDINKYLKMIVSDTTRYLPANHILTSLLNELLMWAEKPCNYILLPYEEMNCNRYSINNNGETLWLYDFVPCTMYHIFDHETLGRYFDGECAAKEWILREKLQCAFYNNEISIDKIIPMTKGMNISRPRLLATEKEIKEMLCYMIDLLKRRNLLLNNNPGKNNTGGIKEDK